MGARSFLWGKTSHSLAFPPKRLLTGESFDDDCGDGDGDSDALQMTMMMMMTSTSSGDPCYTTITKVLMITTNKGGGGGVVLLLRSYDNCSTL